MASQKSKKNSIPISETMLLQRIDENVLCNICGRYPAYTGFVASHIHIGCHTSPVMIDVCMDRQCDCGNCCICIDNKNRIRYNLGPKIMKEVHYFYCCETCYPALQENVTYQYCILCPKLTFCPACKKYDKYESIPFCQFEDMELTCNICGKNYKPSENPLVICTKHHRRNSC